MRALLVCPPVSNFFYPPLGLASLKAFVEDRSQHRVSISDLSILALRSMLSADFLDNCRGLINGRLGSLLHTGLTDPSDQKEYADSVHALIKLHKATASLDETLLTFKNLDALTNRDRRRGAIRALDDMLEIVSAAYYPFKITRDVLAYREAPYVLSDVLHALATERSPFCDIVEQFIAIAIERDKPSVIGLSVSYYGQLIAALEVARYLDRAYPNIPVILGGSLMPDAGTALARYPPIASLFDAIMCYEGETGFLALLDLIERNDGRIPIAETAGIPNLICVENGNAFVRLRHRENVQDLPAPEFGGLDLGAYLSPQPILPILTSRGCYWGACTFCTHFHTYGNDYRSLTPAQVVGQIVALSRRFDTKYFYFVDESLAPSKARGISRALLEADANIIWGTEIRFERSLDRPLLNLMAQSGCRILSFGLESASQDILDRMDKGIHVADLERVVAECRDVGIGAHVMCIVGFPGETRVQVAETLQFLERHEKQIVLAGFSPFTLNRNSIVHQKPEAFGLTIASEQDPLKPHISYNVSAGLGAEEAKALFLQIEESELIKRIDNRISIGTREHFLFISDCYYQQQEEVDLRETSFGPSVATPKYRKAQLDMITVPISPSKVLNVSPSEERAGPNCSFEDQESVTCGYLWSSGRIFEASSSLGRLIEALPEHIDIDSFERLFKSYADQSKNDPVTARRVFDGLVQTGFLEIAGGA